MLSDGVNWDNVRVMQIGRRFRFNLKALDEGRRGKVTRQDHFEGYHAIERDLPRLVDDAHSAPADLFDQFVIAKEPRLARTCFVLFSWALSQGQFDKTPRAMRKRRIGAHLNAAVLACW